MTTRKRRNPSTGGRKKKALAEIPERAPVARKKMAAFFDPESGSKDGAPEKQHAKEKVMLPETEKHLKRVAVKVHVSSLPADPAAAKPAAAAVKKKKEPTPEKAKASPAKTVKKDAPQADKSRESSAKGGAATGGKEQVAQQPAPSGGGSSVVGYVALFAAIAALGLVWFFASTTTGSPSVLKELRTHEAALVKQVDALSAKVDALEAKMKAAEKEKLVKSVNSSLEAIDKLAADADPKTAEALKKMKAEMEKLAAGMK